MTSVALCGNYASAVKPGGLSSVWAEPTPPPLWLKHLPSFPANHVETYGAKEHPESPPPFFFNGFQLYLVSLLPALDQVGGSEENPGGPAPPTNYSPW